MAQSPATERAPDTMAARVLACASCHGAEGEGTSDVYFPRLAGKPAGYLYNQLVAFRDGRRKYPPMNYLLEFLPDAYLKQIAEHFASLRPPFPPPAVPDRQQGNPGTRRSDRHQRRSAARYSAPAPVATVRRFGGMEPAIPGLLGPARQLHQRATRRLALRHANRHCAGLHADRRRPPDRRRRQGGGRLSVVASGADGPVVRPRAACRCRSSCGSEPN